jgi:hypothetical protein
MSKKQHPLLRIYNVSFKSWENSKFVSVTLGFKAVGVELCVCSYV